MSGLPSNQQAITHICQILEMDPQVATFLEDHQIKSVRRLAITPSERYEELVNLTGSPLSRADIDQLKLFKTWYTNQILQSGSLSNESIINKFTEKVWDEFCRTYLVHVHNQQAQESQEPQTQPRGAQVPELAQPVPALKVSLRDYPITTDKASD